MFLINSRKTLSASLVSALLGLSLMAVAHPAAAMEYMVFGGGHSGTIYMEEIAGQATRDDDHPAVGYDALFLFGENSWGFGVTYTYTGHKLKLASTGIELKQAFSGPGLVFSTLFVDESGAKTGVYIGVESLGLSSKASRCGVNSGICDDLEDRLDGQRATALAIGIVGTANGLGLGFNARAFQFDELKETYQVNFMFGLGL